MRAAAEAVVEALFVIDVKAGRLLIMERAAALKLSSSLGDFNRAPDERGEQCPRA
jgi:hypothetical protein